MPAETTPMMQQYLDIKAQNPDSILFFRLGDFYEMFNEDAKLVSKELDLTLTTRDRNKPPDQRTPMCGVPYHSSDSYIARLIAKGYKVAICEQTEDPAQAKGLVDRDIIRVVTPGTATSPSMLEEGKNNYICAVCGDSAAFGLCLCDVSTGEVYAAAFPAGEEGFGHLQNELGRFHPAEAVLSSGAWDAEGLVPFLKERLGCLCENGGEARFRPQAARSLAEQQFKTGLDRVPPQGEAAVRAAGGLLAYLYETQKTDLSHISELTYYTAGQFMELDLTARQTLELTSTLRGKEKKGSLLWVLDKTKTAMGGRLLRGWIERPLLSPERIARRQQGVADLVEDAITRQELALALREVTDLERLAGRVVCGSAGCRDLAALSAGLGKLPRIRDLLSHCSSPLLQQLREGLDDLPQLRAQLDSGLRDEEEKALPFSVREGDFIRPGYNPQVDELRSLLTNANSHIIDMEVKTKEQTGIKNMKITSNKIFGYYIEVAKSQTGLVPAHWTRKQTTVNAERYISPELKELEHAILSAREQVTALEYRLFCELRQAVCDQVDRLQKTAAAAAQVDVLCSLAAAAAENGYCMPQVDGSGVLTIAEGRHPVVEKMLKGTPFVPNDTRMDGDGDLAAIITGPNMAGKSTYMRQVALITIMAQIGSFVPARSARIGVVDRIFTRIGASDDLSSGQSTFMVEMTEVAALLNHATRQSLLILDEIGRGTSTYDGMAIARAVLECCADKARLGCKTLFATHYHELTALEGALPGVKNYNIAAKKRGGEVIFLRKIVRGGADQSYGVEVARLAGVPDRVVERAREILEELESGAGGGLRAAPSPDALQREGAPSPNAAQREGGVGGGLRAAPLPGTAQREGGVGGGLRAAPSPDAPQREGGVGGGLRAAPSPNAAQREGAPSPDAPQREGGVGGGLRAAPSSNAAQREGAPSPNAAQREGAPSPDALQRGGTEAAPYEEAVLNKLRMTDVNILSPIEALNLLAELKQELNGG